MKILYITQYFPPEIGAGAVRALNITKCFSELGHEVQIISEIPNYPDGEIPPKYRNKIFYNKKYKDLDILRTSVHASNRNTSLKMILLYFSFMISSCVGALRCKKPDLIIATSPPLSVVISGYFISRIKRTKLLLDIRDLWVDSAVVVGALKDGTLLYSASKRLENFLYNKADMITVPVYGFGETIKQRTKTPIFHLPNTVNLRDFIYTQAGDMIKEKYKFDRKFLILYSGNHGLAQGLEFILQSALELRKFKDILYLFIGEGVKKSYLEKMKQKLKLDNVIFMSKKSHKEMPNIINISDICLVPLRKNNLFLNALPSKMFEYMALRKPVIVSIKGEAKKLIEAANAGITIEPESSSELSKAILKLYKNREISKKFGEKGYQYINRFYSHENQLISCEELLRRV